ncbi:hypothetical protein IWQ60_004894 [Tieghemiomyces parasiticus]|uniref:Uncharacterized protein n=1 Tax=Tieghemiomyces parasiticus TaxID=78921 RepID=A0A9W8DZC8_9FUNG|nr:hypothetical protein IWQ60_004894 [Tieghemiomyces parasiticus]
MLRWVLASTGCLLLSAATFTSAVVVAGDQPRPNPPRDCVSPDQYNPDIDYYPDKWEDYGHDLFTVEYHKSYKVVKNPFSSETFVLYKCGTPLPDKYRRGNYKVFETPVQRIGVVQNSTQSFLYKLGYANMIPIAGSSAAPANITTKAEGTFDKPYDRFRGKVYALTPEQYDSVDIVFTGHSQEEEKYVTASEASAPSALKRSEWLGFYSLFVDREKEAMRRVKLMGENYRCMKDRVQEVLAERQAQPLQIAWARREDPQPANDQKVTWVLSMAKFKWSLTSDAGATMVNEGIESSFTNPSAMRFALIHADVLIDESYGTHTIDDVLYNFGIEDTPDDAKKYKFIRNRMILREDGLRTACDGNADVLLQDFIRAVYMPDSRTLPRLWFRNLGREEVLSVMKSGKGDNGTELEKLRPYGCDNMDWDSIKILAEVGQTSASAINLGTGPWPHGLATLIPLAAMYFFQ